MLLCRQITPTHARHASRTAKVETSDQAENALPIWKSKDLVHWHRSGSVFPRTTHPWWALAPGHAGGKFWGPEIYRLGGRWVIYFAASYDRSMVDLRLPDGSRVASQALNG